MGRGRARQSGVTLVELMITLVVASLVAASTYAFFTGQQRLYDTQTKLLNVQQNITAAMEMVSRYVRAAGTGMLGCVRLNNSAIDPGAPPPVSNGTALATAPATGLRAYLSGTGAIRIPPLWISDGPAGAPDAITVAFGNGSFGNWYDSVLGTPLNQGQPATSPLTLSSAGETAHFRTNEFVVVLDIAALVNRGLPLQNDRGCTLFQITGFNAATLLHASTSIWNPPGDVAAMVPFTYPVGVPGLPAVASGGGVRHFGTLNWVRFAIQPGTVNTPPALTMQRLDLNTGPQVLADGIEDLQVAYGCDRNSDGSVTDGVDRTTDEWELNANAEVPFPINCQRPDAIRLTIIARSLTPDTLLLNVTSNVKPAAENGAPGGAQDQFRHRVLTTTIYPRNLQ